MIYIGFTVKYIFFKFQLIFYLPTKLNDSHYIYIYLSWYFAYKLYDYKNKN